ncbi:sulfotransferase domain-containing protein [Desulfatibacillum aliphaticivorans]|uniref:sulfotransferase domain-containing protein n=1 Tax=Desulfatibacillum aliphaticivorans TaxID=218208 RepID=UPI00047FE662|nr:sulfotransferase domain-containing protein [Desulfatibacillum aliphaticivorans]
MGENSAGSQLMLARSFLSKARQKALKNAQSVKNKVDRRLYPDQWTSAVPPDFLIIGLQKSGTSWVTNLLNRHPQVAVAPSHPGVSKGVHEGHFFDMLSWKETDHDRFVRVLKNKHDGYFDDFVGKEGGLAEDAFLAQISQRYNSFIARMRTSPNNLAGDKTTEYVFHLDLVDKLYPGIKKICILRDPRDRTMSFHFHQIRKGRRDNDEPALEQIESYCDRLESELRCLLSYQDEIHFLTYEELSKNTSVVVSSFLTYVGIKADEALIDQLVEAASFERVSGRKQGQADAKSHYRKGVVGDWKHFFKEEHLAIYARRINPLVERLMAEKNLDLKSYLS